MNILTIIVFSLASIIELFILCKLMGYRQLSQMSMFDYVNGITIGNIAAEMATSTRSDFIKPFIAMIVYSAVAIFLSWLSSKSIIARRWISGKPVILLNHGTLYKESLKKSKIDLHEFLTQCRIHGYFDLSELESAILEGNGKISFLPKNDCLFSNLIIDGKVMEHNLRISGKNQQWLMKKLHGANIQKVEDVFLATCDPDGHFNVYPYTHKKLPPEIF